MKQALDLAQSAAGQTSPNPLVGSVIVKEGRIIGMGAHLKAGQPHAEIHALNMAGGEAQGADLYVTLEPCSHHGRTGPCADAIIRAGIRRVVVAVLDPNPLVSGQGIQKLEAAGVIVETGVCEQQAAELNRMFFTYIRKNRPFVTLKHAITLDGKITVTGGRSEKITGPDVQQDVHKLRLLHDAILVGAQTVALDNPRLTNRFADSPKQPIRVVLDRQLRIPIESHVIQVPDAPTWIIVGSGVDIDSRGAFPEHVEILQLDTPDVDIASALEVLAARKVLSVLVEGGQKINTAFLQSGQVDEIATYIAPIILGDEGTVSVFGDLHASSASNGVRLETQKVERIGTDLKIISTLKE
ncbi:riboflavin biosynthesis protein RibD [Planococcus maritimus]|nr:bifunctional diaminohydroxyphosphoribosylaminopyrimidine deaminase/5-amino-6-(5-phosphoribosylamino)uracil reductase [Planococcus maritimus]OED31672.1 riboflavin biosynthesis protein RibD [Planococcus maritimus]